MTHYNSKDLTNTSLPDVSFAPLHTGQAVIRDSDAKYKVISCGRRFGKSFLAKMIALDHLINKGHDVWLVYPSSTPAETHWQDLIAMTERADFITINRNHKRIESNYRGKRGSLYVKSADKPHNLRGSGLHLVILDETAFMPEKVWTEITFPMLADHDGDAIFISTPNGKSNWFYRLFLKGFGDNPDKGWMSWNMPSHKNPHISKDYLKQAKSQVPAHTYKQEFLAEFIDNAGGAFNNLEKVSIMPYGVPNPDTSYVIGVDWARKGDFTVFSVFEKYTGIQVDMVRFTDIDYAIQLARLKRLIAKWQPKQVICETNSMGSVLFETLKADLKDENVRLKPFYTTNASKQAIINKLAVAIEKGRVKLLDPSLDANTEAQLFEMGSYEIGFTATKQVTFNAPRGSHDDTVMATAIAFSGCKLKRNRKRESNNFTNPFYAGYTNKKREIL